ncbi:MAG: mechanosensitive ion channel [Acidobacteria bacterium]|nr:mechanosensitive ion channel [Acidobacteriota bacterium]
MQGLFDKNWVLTGLLALGLTGLLVFVLWLLHLIWMLGYRRIDEMNLDREAGKGIWRVLFARGRLPYLLRAGWRLLRWGVTLVLLDVYLIFVSRLFPSTTGLNAYITELTLKPLRSFRDGFIEFIPDLFFILVTIVLTIAALKFLRVLFYEIGVGRIKIPGFYSDWAVPTYKLARFLMVVMVVVVIFPYLPGGKSPAAQGITIFLGVLVSLGSSSAVSNVIAGVILTYTRAFKIGDYVKIGSAVGNVVEKNFLITRVRTVKNETITIPNATVQGSEVVNYSRMTGHMALYLYTSVTIGYDTPWPIVHELLLNAARATNNIVADPLPYVLQTALNDFYVTYEINAATSEPDLMVWTYSDLHQNIQVQFNQAGVEIMSPHYTSLRDGNTITVPAGHRPATYRAPAFHLQFSADRNRNKPE